MKEACLERDWNNNDLLKLATPTSSLLLSGKPSASHV
jgi:hypothetical protein